MTTASQKKRIYDILTLEKWRIVNADVSPVVGDRLVIEFLQGEEG
jgi:hypothetical protein